jgi:uncharacterized protein (DUF1499 family)
MKKNLKEMARVFEEALFNSELESTVYNIVNGNYLKEDYNIVMKYLDLKKAKFGKRNFNLIAYIGNRTIEQYFIDDLEIYLNRNQTVAIYKYLSDIAKNTFKSLVMLNLIEFYEDF